MTCWHMSAEKYLWSPKHMFMFLRLGQSPSKNNLEGWGCSSVGRVTAYHARYAGFYS